ncbi:MAG: CDP-alcohol phosphatidyltransferase family protein, partial [Bacilli bacterium]|nr:CDP-alcohol phosphatidyltransferase family protein [Bacilli bacterium]
MKLNLPNKITLARMIIVIFIIIIALFPYASVGWTVPVLFTIGETPYTLTRIIIFILFIVGSISDFVDGHIARSRNIVTVFGKFLDPIADKLLVNVLYMILAAWGEIPVIIPIIFIIRDTIVDAIRLLAIDQ